MKFINKRKIIKTKITRKTDELNNLIKNIPLSSSEVIHLSMEIDELILQYFTYMNKKPMRYKLKK